MRTPALDIGHKIVKYMVMKEANIHDVKARLSEYIEMVERGERVVICRRNQPVAELRAVGKARTAPRPLGGGNFSVPAAFFDPLPDDVVDAFYGEVASGASTAAEPRKGRERRGRPRRKGTK